MTAKIIQLVNSAFFGLGRRTTDLREAIAYLGIETLRALVLLGGVLLEFRPTRPIPGFSLEAIERHSTMVSAVAAAMAPSSGRDLAVTGGMLHDVGKLVLASRCPCELTQAIALAEAEGWPLHEAERQVLGTTHAEIGAYLLSLWGMPHPVVETVAYHHRPSQAGSDIVAGPAVIHLADAIVHAREEPEAVWVGRLLDLASLADVGLDERVGEWTLRAEAYLERGREAA
jgi:putative nucleotidyltransferase with HDIG domain